jgi:hypothetical protein
MGILTPSGTRRWGVADGRASVKGRGRGVSSTRRCSGHGGEGRRRAVSAAWRHKGGCLL